MPDALSAKEIARRTRPSGAPDPGLGGTEHRTPYERDLDRLYYTYYFRRLAEVTQVYSVRAEPSEDEGSLQHNRMTHSLKVGQVGRRIAQHLLAGKRPPEDLDPDVVEAAGRAHDFGHPPFGHLGEMALDLVARRHNLPDGFEGNAQTFRILASLGYHLPSGGGADTSSAGMDLTNAVVAACMKYPWARGESGRRFYKYGYYEADADYFETYVQPLLPAEGKPTLEADIMDWADDITYAVHDVEDFFLAGIVPLDRLAHRSEGSSPEDRYRALHPDEFNRFMSYSERKLDRLGKEVPDGVRERVVEYSSRFPRRPFDGTTPIAAATGALCSKIITDALSATSVGRDGSLVVDGVMRSTIELLKQLTWFYVIDRPHLATRQAGETRMVTDLTEHLIAWVTRQYARQRDEPWGGEPVTLTPADRAARKQVLPVALQERVDALLQVEGRGPVYDEYPKNIVRGVLDYVASLPERRVIELYEKMLPRPSQD